MTPLAELTSASLAFFGTHIAMSHPLRPLLMKLGEAGFQIVYNLVSLATLVWMVIAFRAALPADLPGSGDIGWILATLLTLPALLLFLGSLTPRNPSMPLPGAATAARAGPAGVFTITRHPMMWGFALWALSHLVLWWSWRTVIVALTILALALIGARLQDAKKRVQMGEAWTTWEAQTSFHPRLTAFARIGWKGWAAAVLAWGVLTWVHWPLAGIPAGLLRWL